jgi:hypothetical protein
MKRFLSVALPVTAVILLAGVAFAQMGGPMAGGMGGGMMGPGMMGGGMMGQGGQAGQWNCPGMAASGQQTPATQITDEKARELAQQYANQYLKGFTVEKVLPFTMPHGTGYSVELKGPDDEVRIFHINPWGNVMPFGGPQRLGRAR